MTQVYKELRCINKIPEFPFVCNHYLDDMPLGDGVAIKYCKRCKIWWEIIQTSEFNLSYRRLAEPPKREYHRGGVIMEES